MQKPVFYYILIMDGFLLHLIPFCGRKQKLEWKGNIMEQFFIILGVIVGVLLLIVIFGGKKYNWRKILYFFIEETDENGESLAPRSRPRAERPKASSKQAGVNRRNPNQPYTEMAILMQKIDERRRVVDSSGHSTLYDEYFELVFETRKGETLHLTASRAAFKEVPFNQQGSLTHKRGQLVKFKYVGGLVSDEYVPVNRP